MASASAASIRYEIQRTGPGYDNIESERTGGNKVATGRGSVAKASHDHFSLISQSEYSVVDSIAFDDTATARIDPQDDGADSIVFGCLLKASYDARCTKSKMGTK
jgi:hypothetical protein